MMSLASLSRDLHSPWIVAPNVSCQKRKEYQEGLSPWIAGREANPFFVIGLSLLSPLEPSGDSDYAPSNPQSHRSCPPDRCTRVLAHQSIVAARPTCDSPDSVQLGDRPRLMAAWAQRQDGEAHAAAMPAPRPSLSVVRSSDGAEFPLHRDDFRNITT